MTAAKLLQRAGFRVVVAAGQSANWGVSTEVFSRTTRFRSFIMEVLTADTGRRGLLPARMVGLDGIPVEALEVISEPEGTPYGIGEVICIEWKDQVTERIDRRILSPLTLLTWPSIPTTSPDGSNALTAMSATNLVEGLDHFLSESDIYCRLRNRREQLALDSICWCHEALPPTLFAHLSGLALLSALPRSAWARGETGKVTVAKAGSVQLENDVGATGELLDAAFESGGPDRGTLVLQLALDYLGEKHSEVDGVNKRAWAQKMLGLQSRALSAGPITSLSIAWIADLCEYGTVRESNPADSTVQSYPRRALIALHGALCSLNSDLSSGDWSPTKMALNYEAMIAAQSRGNQGTMRAALASFHDFLVRHLDIEPLHRPLRTDEPIKSPNAQVIWPHEIARVLDWTDLHPDKRVAEAAAIVISIAREAPCRSQELMRLRVRNVLFAADAQGRYAEIEIARNAQSGRLKTPTSQRRLTIRNSETLTLLEAWLLKRKAQGATPDAFLFGDPGRHSERYRPSATVSFVNRLLKTATGEAFISLHTLRHTAISNAMSEVWSSSSSLDVNPIEVLAAHAGHASPLSTLLTYSHRYEAGIRLWLDVAMSELIQLNHLQAAGATGLTSANIRAKASRGRISISSLAWGLIRSLKVPVRYPLAQEGFNWQQPGVPSVEARGVTELTFDVALALLRGRLLDNIPTAELARRFGFNDDSITEWESDLTTYCSQRAHAIHPRKLSGSDISSSGLPLAVASLGIDLCRLQQPKYQALVEGLGKGVSQKLLTDALISWERCHVDPHISLLEGTQALNLYRLLKEVGVDGNALRLCFQLGSVYPNDSHLLVRQMTIDAFEAAFGKQPRVTDMKFSPNRPGAYLQWDTATSPGAINGASGGSVAGLNAAMIGVKSFLLLSNKVAT